MLSADSKKPGRRAHQQAITPLIGSASGPSKDFENSVKNTSSSSLSAPEPVAVKPVQWQQLNLF